MNALDELLKVKNVELKNLKLRLKKLKKEEVTIEAKNKVTKQITVLEQYIHKFRKAAMHPVKIDGIIINYKLYELFMNKLKDFHITQEVIDGHLIIQYKNKVSNGTFILEDLTGHFPDVSLIQEGELHVIL